jgi:hypothetical protein
MLLRKILGIGCAIAVLGWAPLGTQAAESKALSVADLALYKGADREKILLGRRPGIARI